MQLIILVVAEMDRGRRRSRHQRLVEARPCADVIATERVEEAAWSREPMRTEGSWCFLDLLFGLSVGLSSTV